MSSETEPAQGPSVRPLDESIVLVEPGQRGTFEKRLAALNAKAQTFGLAPLTILGEQRVTYRRTVEPAGLGGEKFLVQLVPVQPGEACDTPVLLDRIHIQYPQVRLGNWSVVAKLEATEFGNVSFAVSQAPEDLTVIRRFAEEPLTCEHCRKKRVRLDGYILRDGEATGRYKQVGSTCLQDFTGVDPAAALFLATMARLVHQADDDLDSYARSGARNSFYTREYLADVAFLASHFGFVSAAKAADRGIEATFSEAAHIGSILDDRPELRACYAAERERHLAAADAIREWAAARPEVSDFDRNIKLLLQSDLLDRDRKHLAVAAAAVAMYARHHEAEVQRQRPSVHIGVEGQKTSAVLTIDRVVEWPNPYVPRASTYLVLMQDDDRNRLAWRTAAPPADVVNGKGRRLAATFKVKKHDTYNDVAQTHITHLKVTSWLDLEQPRGAPQHPEDQAPASTGSPLRMSVSIYRHPPGARTFSDPVLVACEMDEAELIQQAGLHGIRAILGGGEHAPSPYPSFESRPDQAGATYSLHVQAICGREPGLDELRNLAILMDVPAAVAKEHLAMP